MERPHGRTITGIMRRYPEVFPTRAAVGRAAQVAVRGGIGRPPMSPSASAELFAMARTLMPDLEGKVVGGGSDGNFTAALGVPTLDGLGAVGGGAHADHEYLVIDAMAERANLIAGLARAIQSS